MDSVQQGVRDAILREMGRRAMTARVRAQRNESERETPEAEATASTVTRTDAGSDTERGTPNAM
jgi:hypothetical protein